jgi:hypothetical protein
MTEAEKAAIEEVKKRDFLKPFETIDDLNVWVEVYLGITLPYTNVSGQTVDADPAVIHAAPGLAIWEAYKTYKEDLYVENPGYIWIANRDGAKTLSGSILNTLLLVHFKAEIAHLAAVKKQAEKCIEYTNIWMRKINPYLEHHGRKIVSDSKSKIQVQNEDGTVSYIDVVVANLAGGNSQRAHVGSYDELDTLSKQGLQGYKEAKLIPTRKNGHGPLRIKYSTRKFRFGVFAKEIEQALKGEEDEELKAAGIRVGTEKVVQWNLLDITEHCPASRNKRDDGQEHERWVKKELPMKLYKAEEVAEMKDQEQAKMRPIKLHTGCLKCPLAAVCQGKLGERPETDVAQNNSLFKTIDFAIGQFRVLKGDPDMAEAQLLCWKPSAAGLVYPRYSDSIDNGNVLTVARAYEKLTGDKKEDITFDELIEIMHSLEIRFYGGLDWGYGKEFTMVVGAKMPDGSWWLVANYASPGLELDDQVEAGIPFQLKYQIKKWYPDQAYPGSIKTWKRKVGPCEKFTKDVMGGIEATRGVIMNAQGQRKMFVIVDGDGSRENGNFAQRLRDTFTKHAFQLDNTGEPTENPDDGEFSDTADSIRYLFQNVAAVSKRGPMVAKGKPAGNLPGGEPQSLRDVRQLQNPAESLINKQTGAVYENMNTNQPAAPRRGGKKGFSWSF